MVACINVGVANEYLVSSFPARALHHLTACQDPRCRSYRGLCLRGALSETATTIERRPTRPAVRQDASSPPRYGLPRPPSRPLVSSLPAGSQTRRAHPRRNKRFLGRHATLSRLSSRRSSDMLICSLSFLSRSTCQCVYVFLSMMTG